VFYAQKFPGDGISNKKVKSASVKLTGCVSAAADLVYRKWFNQILQLNKRGCFCVSANITKMISF